MTAHFGSSALPRFLWSVAALAVASSVVAFAQIDVAICAAASASSTDCRFTDVQTKLSATGRFGTVDIINAATSTPTLAQLQAYDAVLVWSNSDFQDSTLLGDTLADYVDAGGGVVVAVFANSYASAARAIGGRWQSGYEVILDQGGTTTGAATLGVVDDSTHPVMANVAAFDGGTSAWRPTATALQIGARRIASWSDGKVLVAEGANKKRIDLGFYPPSNTCFAPCWVATTDGDVLMANALECVAAKPDVAICAAAAPSSTDCRFTDVQSKLLATGRFGSVDVINAATSTPTLAQLQAYDAVLVWSNVSFQNSTLLGDRLADYVDAGGGVVVATFANSATIPNTWIGGRWQTGYEVILDQSGYTTGAASLGTVAVPGHPVMANMSTFSGGTSSYRPTGTALESGSTLIASWSDGKVLAAQGASRRRVDLGMYPPSSACSASSWLATTDGATLMANALAFVGKPRIDVAICASAATLPTDCRFTDVQSKLAATDQFDKVDILDAYGSTPTLAQLQVYDAVLVWSNYGFQNQALLGDTLADYVDSGGGVVVATFANSSPTNFIGGRWQNGYEVILDQGGTTTGAASLGAVVHPWHPLMEKVSTFSGGTNSFRPTGTALQAGSTLIASWSDGKVLAAIGASRRRVDLGMYPTSNACVSTSWIATTDGATLMANALIYVAGDKYTGTIVDTCQPAAPDVTDGCTPDVSWAGRPDVAQCNTAGASDFVVTFGAMAENKNCNVVVGKGAAVSSAWSTQSTKCFPTPYSRTGFADTGDVNGATACGGQVSLDVEAYLQGGNPLLTPAAAGEQYVVQAWYRDPASPKTTQMSDAVAFTVSP